MDIGLTGEALNNAMLKGQYRTVYQGERYSLDMHAQGSSNRGRRRGFRVYFA